jgi:hypothetical protein
MSKWRLEVPLAGIPAAPLNFDIPTGCYITKTVDTDPTEKTKDDGTKSESIRFSENIVEAFPMDPKIDPKTLVGLPISIWLGRDLSKPMNLKKWKSCALSHGFKAEQLERTVPMEHETYLNKSAYVWVQAKPAAAPGAKKDMDDHNFVTAEQFKALREGAVKVSAAGASSAAPATTTGNGAAAGAAPSAAAASEMLI